MARFHTLGPFRLDAEAEVLYRGKEALSLGQRAVALLRVLVARPGELISKDALMDAAWRGLAVEESNLAVQISALRRILGEEPGGEGWIETLPRRGYRYIGPVVSNEASDSTPTATPSTTGTEQLPTKILVVDDHVLIREALRGVLKELAAGAVLLEAPDGATAMQLIEEHCDLTLILLDLNLPDCDGLAVLAELRERYPAISIVVLSALQDRANVMKALKRGALGFIPKSATRDVMMQALRLVFAGGIYIPPQILDANPTATNERDSL
jgi:DNA-binding response OmpR family regulator